MIKAFVFGKFLPFHKGHEAMINFALTKCDFLAVFIRDADVVVLKISSAEGITSDSDVEGVTLGPG